MLWKHNSAITLLLFKSVISKSAEIDFKVEDGCQLFECDDARSSSDSEDHYYCIKVRPCPARKILLSFSASVAQLEFIGALCTAGAVLVEKAKPIPLHIYDCSAQALDPPHDVFSLRDVCGGKVIA